MADDTTAAERSALQKLLDKVAGAKGDASSWPVTVFLLAFFVILLSVIGIKLALTKRKAAELAADLEESKQEVENAKLAKDEEQRKANQVIIDQAKATIANIQKEMDTRKVEHDEYVHQLSTISSWDDIEVKDANA